MLHEGGIPMGQLFRYSTLAPTRALLGLLDPLKIGDSHLMRRFSHE